MRISFSLILLQVLSLAAAYPAAAAPDLCYSQARCRGRVLYKNPYVIDSVCSAIGGRSMKIKNSCYNLVVNPAPEAPGPGRPAKPSLNIGDVCLDASCECVNGTTVYMNQRCGG